MSAYPLAYLDDVTVFIGDALPVLPIWWSESGDLIDFVAETSTFVLTVTAEQDLNTSPETHAFVKTTGITGATGSGTADSGTPNVTITWANTGDLNDLPAAGDYLATLTATTTADSLARTLQFKLVARARHDS